MVTLYSTVRDILSRPNPPLSIQTLPGENTHSPDYLGVPWHHITPWDDFSFDNISAAYGDLLDEKVEDKGGISYRDSQGVISNEDTFDTVGNFWTSDVVRIPMKQCALILQKRLGETLKEPSIQNKRIEYRGELHLKPDWMVTCMADRKHQFVVGDSKLSTKWKSEWLQSSGSHLRAGPTQRAALSPIRQIATYCYYFKTRYGYILTPEELVVFRVYSWDDEETQKPKAGVQWKAIPWGSSGDRTLTVNLGFWALIMMSVADPYRHVGSQHIMFPLSWWQPVGGSDFYKHHLSGRQQTRNKIDPTDKKARFFLLQEGEPKDHYGVIPDTLVERRVSARGRAGGRRTAKAGA